MTFLWRIILIVILVYLFPFASDSLAQDSTYVLLGKFADGWQKHWLERKVGNESTQYEVVEDDDQGQVLQASSETSASMMWHMLNLDSLSRATLSWSWKVESALTGDISERAKMGDDYAARVFVVFEPHPVSWKTKAICYVWAAKEPVGTMYENPYASHVRMVVVESGDERTDEWILEERNVISDYREAFGGDPEMISAVALMVDTDNSNQEAYTRFDDMTLKVFRQRAEAADSRRRPIIQY